MRLGIAGALALVIVSCAPKPQAATCPYPDTVAPASVGGAAEVRSLATRLSGPDQENAVIAGAQELHRRDATLSADRITDILVAADCEGHQVRLGATYNPADRTRVITEQVNAIMIKNPPTGG